jgi:hypothetical protein
MNEGLGIREVRFGGSLTSTTSKADERIHELLQLCAHRLTPSDSLS